MFELEIPLLTDESDIFQLTEKHKLRCVNWASTYPYKPHVEFAIGHMDNQILLKFFVEEKSVMAKVTDDNGPVWTDSCVEFFISFDDEGYYNFEFNSIGTMLLGFRKEREKYEHANQEILDSVCRVASLGNTPFDEKNSNQYWTLAVVIPVDAFFNHNIKSLAGISAKANFYKCGDHLTEPHFISWNPIDNPVPDFHKEKNFGKVNFLSK